MRKSYGTQFKSSIIDSPEFKDLERVEFIKRDQVDEKLLIGAEVRGILYIKKKGTMKSDSSSLAIIGTDERPYLFTIPTWVGSAIFEDFISVDQTAEEYFGGYKISKLKDVTTKTGNKTFDVEFSK